MPRDEISNVQGQHQRPSSPATPHPPQQPSHHLTGHSVPPPCAPRPPPTPCRPRRTAASRRCGRTRDQRPSAGFMWGCGGGEVEGCTEAHQRVGGAVNLGVKEACSVCSWRGLQNRALSSSDTEPPTPLPPIGTHPSCLVLTVWHSSGGMRPPAAPPPSSLNKHLPPHPHAVPTRAASYSVRSGLSLSTCFSYAAAMAAWSNCALQQRVGGVGASSRAGGGWVGGWREVGPGSLKPSRTGSAGNRQRKRRLQIDSRHATHSRSTAIHSPLLASPRGTHAPALCRRLLRLLLLLLLEQRFRRLRCVQAVGLAWVQAQPRQLLLLR